MKNFPFIVDPYLEFRTFFVCCCGLNNKRKKKKKESFCIMTTTFDFDFETLDEAVETLKDKLFNVQEKEPVRIHVMNDKIGRFLQAVGRVDIYLKESLAKGAEKGYLIPSDSKFYAKKKEDGKEEAIDDEGESDLYDIHIELTLEISDTRYARVRNRVYFGDRKYYQSTFDIPNGNRGWEKKVVTPRFRHKELWKTIGLIRKRLRKDRQWSVCLFAEGDENIVELYRAVTIARSEFEGSLSVLHGGYLNTNGISLVLFVR